jgi:hypothetical protein
MGWCNKNKENDTQNYRTSQFISDNIEEIIICVTCVRVQPFIAHCCCVAREKKLKKEKKKKRLSCVVGCFLN